MKISFNECKISDINGNSLELPSLEKEYIFNYEDNFIPCKDKPWLRRDDFFNDCLQLGIFFKTVTTELMLCKNITCRQEISEKKKDLYNKCYRSDFSNSKTIEVIEAVPLTKIETALAYDKKSIFSSHSILGEYQINENVLTPKKYYTDIELTCSIVKCYVGYIAIDYEKEGDASTKAKTPISLEIITSGKIKHDVLV